MLHPTPRPQRRPRRLAPAIFFALLIGASCGDGGIDFGLGGCAGGPAEPFVTTEENTVERGVLGRMTRAGVDFLVAQREAIAGLLLDVDPLGRVSFALPVTELGNPDGRLGIGVRDVIAGFNLRAAEVEMAILPDPDRLRIFIKNARVSLSQGVVWVVLGGNAACEISNGIAPGTADEAVLVADFSADVAFEVDEEGRLETRVEFLPFTVHDIDLTLSFNPELEECADDDNARECEIVCGATERGLEIVGQLLDTLQSDLNALVEPVVSQTIDETLQMFNGQPLFMEGTLDPSDVLGTLVPNLAGVIEDAQPIAFRGGIPAQGLFVEPPAGGAEGAEGVRFDLDVGLEAADHPCVPPVDEVPPFFTGPIPTLDGLDNNGQPYHMGLALSSAVINRLLWAAYRGGLLCLAVDTDRIGALLNQQVSSDLLGIILPGLKTLTGTPQPILITLDPAFGFRDFPLVDFEDRGAPGEMPRAGMRMRLPQVGLSFYTRIEERWARLFQARVTLDLGVEVYPTPANTLALAIDPPVITDLSQTYNELLDDAKIPELLDLISNLATSALATDPIELEVGLDGLVSMLTGLPFDPRITGLNVDGASRDFLSLLMRLELSRPGAQSAVETSAAYAEGHGAEGEITLQVSAAHGTTNDRPALYQWRVNGGPWRPWRAADDGRLTVRDSLLRTVGDHTISVRAVAADDYRTLDQTPATVQITTTPLTAEAPAAEPRPEAPAPTQASGCSATAAPGAAGWLLALLPVLGLCRRRKGLLAAVLAALSLTGCGDERKAPEVSCDVSGDCPSGFVCEVGLCVAADQCGTSEDCCAGSVCEGGQCRPDVNRCEAGANDDCGSVRTCDGGRCVHDACADGSQCADGGVCLAGHCHLNPPCTTCPSDRACYAHLGECRRAPPQCDMSCAPGELRVVNNPSAYTGAACDLSQATCSCVPAPPLRPTDVGRYASMALVNGDPVFAAYDNEYGDLVFIEGLDDGASRPVYTYVDGVPAGAPVADPLGPRAGVVEPGPEVGRYASMAISADGQVHIAYYHSDARRLMYARRTADGQWAAPMVVDADGDVGRYADLAVDADGRPHIAYYLAASADALNVGDVSGVRYAVGDSNTPNGFSVVDVSLRLTPEGVAPPTPGDTPVAHGIMPCLALSASGRPFIGFRDALMGEAWLATIGADGFNAAPITGTPGIGLEGDARFADVAEHDLGGHCDLMPLGDGQVGMVLVDETTEALLFYRGDGAEGVFEGVDLGTGGLRRFVGADAALGMDDEGDLVVVYQDASDLDLLMKVRSRDGWGALPVQVDTTGAQGFYITAAVDGQTIVIGALEMNVDAGGRSENRLRVYRRDVPAF
ncbi:MAG: hypothetical protein ACE366_21400 [Bradymonadia bacterium]